MAVASRPYPACRRRQLSGVESVGLFSLFLVSLLSPLPVLLHRSACRRYLGRNRRFPFYYHGVRTTEEIKIFNTFKKLLDARKHYGLLFTCQFMGFVIFPF